MLLDEADEKTASKAPPTSQASQKITLAVIQNTRLDKLLAEIIHAYENESSSARPHIAEVGLESEVEKAQSLQNTGAPASSRNTSRWINTDWTVSFLTRFVTFYFLP